MNDMARRSPVRMTLDSPQHRAVIAAARHDANSVVELSLPRRIGDIIPHFGQTMLLTAAALAGLRTDPKMARYWGWQVEKRPRHVWQLRFTDGELARFEQWGFGASLRHWGIIVSTSIHAGLNRCSGHGNYPGELPTKMMTYGMIFAMFKEAGIPAPLAPHPVRSDIRMAMGRYVAEVASMEAMYGC